MTDKDLAFIWKNSKLVTDYQTLGQNTKILYLTPHLMVDEQGNRRSP